MKSDEQIIKLFQERGNVMRTSELREAKVYYQDIQRLLSENIIEKVKQGYYHLMDENNTNEVHIIKRIYPDAVLCMHTALFHYGYSDRTPAEWHLAVDKNTSKYKAKIDYPFVRIYFAEPDVWGLGTCSAIIDGVAMCMYDRDRTICDCLRYMGKMDKEIFNKAIQGYINDQKKCVPNLMRYAKPLRVQKKVKDLIGVWL